MLEILENCVHHVEVIHKSFSELQYVSNLYYLYFRVEPLSKKYQGVIQIRKQGKLMSEFECEVWLLNV